MRYQGYSTQYYARHEVHWKNLTLNLRKSVSGQGFKHRETCRRDKKIKHVSNRIFSYV